MRCVLDPNVLIAALLSRNGTPAELLRLWFEGAFELVVSTSLLDELERVLAYPKIRSRVGEAEANEFMALLTEAAIVNVDSSGPPSVRSADPDDDYLIVLAESARAVIVSGDKHLLDLSRQIPVYKPADFRRLVSERDDG